MENTTLTLDIQKFEPGKAELGKLANDYKPLLEKEIIDDTQLALVKEARLNLRDCRTTIAKNGKAMRDDANKFAKAVIAKEKEYISIIEPIEKALKEKEDEYNEKKAIESRKEQLPARRAMLGDLAEMTDEEILAMDDIKFSGRIILLQKEKLEKEQAEKEEKERKQREEDERQKQIKEVEERAREDERRKQQAEIDRLQKEKEDRERKEKEEQEENRKQEEQMKKDKVFQEWKREHNYNPKTDIIRNDGRVAEIYRKIASYIIE